MSLLNIQKALISVSDKTSLILLCEALVDACCEIVATGGTAKTIEAAGIPVTEVTSYTKFPEMMDGRVKTLHPKIHGGILARRGIDDEVIRNYGLVAIDLVVINLYPFETTVARDGCTQKEAIENIDIGGPALIRSAAKNHRDVLVIVDSNDYQEFCSRLREGCIDLDFRSRMAAKAFRHTAAYDAAIAKYFSREELFPENLTLCFKWHANLRYGENPHQKAAFYLDAESAHDRSAVMRQLQGKDLSFNNIADTDAALACVFAFEEPACVIVKHANPCGVAIGDSPLSAYNAAYATDPTSAFGGIIAFNRPLDRAVIRKIIDRQFAEVIAAPGVDEDAVSETARKKNLRILITPEKAVVSSRFSFRRVARGLLLQESDDVHLDESELRVVTEREPTKTERADLNFAWKVACFVKSNAIVFARDGRTVGVGAGQTSRVVSAMIAKVKAEEEGLDTNGAVMASDAFFPFRDSIDKAAEAGICAVIQPGGSIRDDEVIAAANEYGISMLFTGIRHFRH